jgi:integrase
MTQSTENKRLDERTQHVRKLILESTYDEPIAPGSSKFFRDIPLSKMTAEAVETLRDRKLQFPEAANGRVKAIRQVFRFAVKKKDASGRPYVASNPTRDVEYFRTGSTGFYTWTVDDVQQYEARHPIGTKARLALALLVFTGQRRSDIIRFGKQLVKSGKLTFTQWKGRNRKPKRLQLPILPALQRIIEASTCGDMTFLVNEFGRPFTDAGFGNKFRDWCDQAGLPQCTAHGLRKAGATIAAENGATAHQLMAIFGWDTLKQAEVYTRAADQKRLAENSMHLIEVAEQKSTESGPTLAAGGTFSEKN